MEIKDFIDELRETGYHPRLARLTFGKSFDQLTDAELINACNLCSCCKRPFLEDGQLEQMIVDAPDASSFFEFRDILFKATMSEDD